MDHRQADALMDELKTKLIRLVVSSFGEVDPDKIEDEQIQKWLEKLDIVNQGRVKYLETLTDFLYEGLRPLLIKDGLISTSKNQTEEPSSPEAEPISPAKNEPQSRSIAKQAPASPFPKNIELPKAVVGKAFTYAFNLDQYYNGHILSPEVEGVDTVRGMEFSVSDSELRGKPKEPGVYDMVLLFLREDKMERDTISFKFIVEPDLSSLPKELKIPKGRVDDEYEEIIPLDRSYKFNFRLEGAAEIGMDFDPDTMNLAGTPTRPGNFFLTLHFVWEGMREQLPGNIVIAFEVEEAQDSYWQNIFPDPNSKFSKSLEEHKQIDTDHFWLIGASNRGPRHRHLGRHREDDFQIRYSKGNGWSVVAISNGHQEAPFARKGSELASKVAEQVVNKRIELYFSQSQEKIENLLQPQGEEAENRLTAFLNYTLTTAIYNAYLYIKRFAASESLPLDQFATTLKLFICYPLGKRGYFFAGTCLGEGAIGLYHDRTHKLELIQDKLPQDDAHGPHLLTNSKITENTKLLNQNISWFLVEDFSYAAVLSEGASQSLFFGERLARAPGSWSHYWNQIKRQVLTGKSDEYSQKLLHWLENPSENKEAFEDRTLVLITPKST